MNVTDDEEEEEPPERVGVRWPREGEAPKAGEAATLESRAAFIPSSLLSRAVSLREKETEAAWP
jgi:hypothetical protein